MKGNIKIPVAVQMVIDDVGWHKGHDQRYKSWPSRSGLPRMHQPEDYVALNAVGKELGVKINCSIVLADWDKNNVLRGVPHVTYDEQGWDRAAEMDMEYAERCCEALESSEYLDYTYHGLLHGYYVDGKCLTEAEFYPYKFDEKSGCYTKEQTWLSKDEFDKHIELFYKIYDAWGLKKKIVSFVSPCGTWGTLEENANYANWIKEHGMIYWANTFRGNPDSVAVLNGVICMNGLPELPWDAYDIDPRFLDLKITEHAYRIDLSEVDNKGAIGKRDVFYISLKNGTVPKACFGGSIREYETHENFKTYDIVRDGRSFVEISLN